MRSLRRRSGVMDEASHRLYHTNGETWDSLFNRKYFVDRQLEVKRIERGVILPSRRNAASKKFEGGVLDADLNFVAGLFRGLTDRGWGNIFSAYKVESADIDQSDEDVIFGGVLMGHFGHFRTSAIIIRR